MDHSADHRRVSAPEAAQYLGFSASTLAKLRISGGGPRYLKLNRRVAYDTRDLDAWLAARRRSSTSDSGLAAGLARRQRRARDAVADEREAARR